MNKNTVKNLNECRMPVITQKNCWSMNNHRMHDNLPPGSSREILAPGQWGRKLLVALVLIIACMQFRVLAQSQGVVLAWNPSVDTNVVGYNIYYGGVSGVYTNEVMVGNVTTATITGLTPGATYYFAATTIGAGSVESPLSNQTTYTVPSPVVLAMQTVQTQGQAASILISATGSIPSQWRIDGSSDLVNWTPVFYGAGSPVNVSLPITSAPAQFFRLVQE